MRIFCYLQTSISSHLTTSKNTTKYTTKAAMDAILSLVTKCLPCFPDLSTPYLSFNSSKYKIIRLLGEGGFSYVYLVSDKANASSIYALKSIRCPYGSNDDSFKNAMKEVKSYHRFANAQSPYIIKAIDEAIIDESDGSKTIYILMPYFQKSLQDIINYNVLNNDTMKEEEVLRIFVGICRGLKVMHRYKKSGGRSEARDDDEEDDLLLNPVSDDEEDQGTFGTELQELVPYAHRDIKPANVMLSAEGLPVLVDLGSCSRARYSIKTRQQALTLTDFALEHCTLPYRAPELLDVATNSEITELTDIWSLGCLLYCCCFNFSPFEKLEIDLGANLNLAISQGNYSFPADKKGYSDELLTIVKDCLKLDPTARPTIDELLDRALSLSH